MKQLITLGLISIIYFLVSIVVLHFLRPDVNPISRPTAEYAVGKYGFLMTTAFFSVGVASLSLAACLYKGISPPAQSHVGLILLVVWGIGVLVIMFLPINPRGTELTTISKIHRIIGPLLFLSLTISTILISISFRWDENWLQIHRLALILSLLLLLFFITIAITAATKAGFLGLFQRAFLAVFVAWFMLTILHLRSIIEN